jgi:predicted Holliday junction resolvase-like endonuclease
MDHGFAIFTAVCVIVLVLEISHMSSELKTLKQEFVELQERVEEIERRSNE